MAYAKRKTDELGIENIEYMQADILDLNNLNKEFDIIESAGVLHHMDNPMAGWKVLTDCLKDGGLMKIGLYSDLARKNIPKTTEEIRQFGIGASVAEMKSYRDNLANSNLEHHKNIITSSDFYSMSSVRDLLFHTKEHHFTLPQIKKCITLTPLGVPKSQNVLRGHHLESPNLKRRQTLGNQGLTQAAVKAK